MKKTFISLSVAALFGSGMAHAVVTTTGNNFTMVSASNGLTGGTNDVTFTWDGTYRTSEVTDGSYNATLASPTAFSGKKWTAHHVNVYGPGNYSFDVGCASGGVASTTYNPTCGSGASYNLSVPAGYVGAHMLFNWSTSADIDVVVLWKMNDSWTAIGSTSAFCTGNSLDPNCPGGTANTPTTIWNGVSIDTSMDVDDYSGTKMIDGPFVGQSANFNVNGIASATPVVSSNNPTGTPGTSAVVEVVFNKAMNPATLTLGSFTVAPTAGGASVCGGAIVASVGDTTFTCTPTALAPNTQYTATVTTAATSAAGFALGTAYPWNFTTTAAASTLTLAVVDPTFGTATVTIPGGGNLASVNLVSSNTINATAPNVTFDSGLLNYRITGTGAGATVAVTINFPASIVGKTLYKIDSTAGSPVYTAIPESDFIRNGNGTTITMNITDCTGAPCASYDVNPVAGTIDDPIGAGTPVVAAAAATLSGGGGGGGCTVDPSGKDASLLVALLASMGYVGWRRRNS